MQSWWNSRKTDNRYNYIKIFRAKTNILNEGERIIFLTNEYSNILLAYQIEL